MSEDQNSKELENSGGPLNDDAPESVTGGLTPDITPIYPPLDPGGPIVDVPLPDPLPLPDPFPLPWVPPPVA